MCGTPNALARRSSKPAGYPACIALEDITLTVLVSQFLESPVHPDRIWHMIGGTGMGLEHSGAVASSAFYDQVEKPLIAIATLQAHRINMFCRYENDVLFIANSRPLFRSFFGRFKELAHPTYSVVVEQVASTSMPYLDLNLRCVQAAPGPKRVEVSPAFKPILNILLGPSSSHPPGTARWPVQMVNRLGSLTSTPLLWEQAKRELIKRFELTAASD